MKVKRFCFFFLLSLLMILVAGCNFLSYYQQDPFYKKGSGSNYLRFPLIKPYYALYISDKYGWGMPLVSQSDSNFYYYIQIHNIQKIAVEKGAIIVYTPITQDVDESVGEKVLYWFVFTPEKNSEMGFDNEVDFLAYIQQLGIQEPLWREPDDILQEYDQTWCLDWIPDCNQ